MPSVVGVQHGSVTITASDGATGTITISSVTPGNAYISSVSLDGGNTSGWRLFRELFTLELTSATQLTWTRHSSASAVDLDFYWEVTEFDSGALERSVQRGRVDVVDNAAASSEDVPITLTSTANAFITCTWNSDQSAAYLGTRGDLTSTSNLRFQGVEASASTAEDVAWEIVEFKASDITSSERVSCGGVDLDDNLETQDTVTLATTLSDTTTALVLHQGLTQGSGGVKVRGSWDITNTTTLTYDRSEQGSTDAEHIANAVVIEFADSPTVQRGALSMAGGSASASSGAYTSTVAARTTQVTALWMQGFQAGTHYTQDAQTNPGQADDTNTSMRRTESGGNVTDVGIARADTAGQIDVKWQTIEWPTGAVGGAGISVKLYHNRHHNRAA